MAALFTFPPWSWRKACRSATRPTCAGPATATGWFSERRQTLYSEDAEHWVRVYTDLLTFNLEMTDVVERRLERGTTSADSAERSDRDLLQAHVRRLRWRLSFWQRRRAQLTPGPLLAGDPPPSAPARP